MAETLAKMANRLCGSRGCEGCPLDNDRVAEQKLCCILEDVADLEEQLEKLRAWAAANPVKSYKDDFFEKFPGAERDADGYPPMWVTRIYGITRLDAPAIAGFRAAWDAPLGTWGEKVVLDERTPPDNGDAACMSCRYEECDVYQEPCLKCVHGEGKTENYRASAAEMERRRKNGR